MVPDPIVIAELQALFKTGATPSRLMRHIITHHEPLPMPEIDRLIRAYFREAFCVPMFRESASLLATGPEGLKIAGINASVIHRMIEMRQAWDQESGNQVESWMDNLVASDQGDLNDRVNPELFPELTGVWNQLEDTAKQYLRRLIGNSQGIYEQVNILSVLVEQLQMQIMELESNQHQLMRLTHAAENAKA